MTQCRLQMEKEYFRQSSLEIESLQATVRSTQEQLKQAELFSFSFHHPVQVSRDKEKIFLVLETRDKENETLQAMIHTIREQEFRDPSSISDRSISTVTRVSPVKTPKISRNIHPKSFASPGTLSKSKPRNGRHSTGGLEEPRSRVDLDSLCKPTFCSTQHHSAPKESPPAPDTEFIVSPPPVQIGGSFRKGTISAMATSRSRDAMMKHQV
jgi:hypothetical protein